MTTPGMVWDIKSPCKSCPYRKDARIAHWHPSEFINLLKQDQCIPGTDISLGSQFGCHEYNKRPPAQAGKNGVGQWKARVKALEKKP